MEQSKIKVLVFDLGKVLLEFDYAIAMKKFLVRSRLNFVELNQLLNQSPLLLDYEAGKMTTLEFFQRVQREAGFSGSLEEFGKDFGDIFEAIPSMVDMHRKLRKAGWRTYLFSNTNELAVQTVRAKFPFYTTFNGHVLSYAHGCMKPQARLYEVVEDMTGNRGAEIFYIDDRPENIEAGRQREWQVWLHESAEKTLPVLSALLQA